MNEWIIPLLFFAVALAYSTVGFGGGSSYLAILSLLSLEFYEIRSIALVLNVLVVSLGTWLAIRNKVFEWKLFWPFLILSVPMAFVGAQFQLSAAVFFVVLGASLTLSSAFLLWQSMNHEPKTIRLTAGKRSVLGGAIGLLSGMVGIGGGIFLSPVLNVSGWANPRKVAALTSVFILVNSISGIFGLFFAETFSVTFGRLIPLVMAVSLGGLLGGYLSNIRLGVSAIRLLTGILVAYVGIRLVILHGFQLSI